MTSFRLQPRTWQRLHRMATWAWRMMLIFWALTLLLWGMFITVIVPQADHWRPQLERWLAQQTGQPIRIDKLAATQKGFWVHVQGQGVQLGQELALPQVWFDVTPWSLWQGKLAQWGMIDPRVALHRDLQGRIHIGSWTLPTHDGKPSKALDAVFSQDVMHIQNGTLTFSDASWEGPPIALTQLNLRLENGLRSHDFQLDALLPAQLGRSLGLRGRLTQPLLHAHAGDWTVWSGQLYAQGDGLQWEAWRKHAQSSMPKDVQAWLPSKALSGNADVRVWLDVAPQQIERIDVQTTQGYARYWPAQPHREAKGEVHVQNLALQPILAWLPAKMIQMPWVQNMGVATDAAKLSGSLQTLHAHWVQTDPPQYQVNAQLSHVLGQWQNKSVRGLSGSLQASHTGGAVHLSIQHGGLAWFDQWAQEIPIHHGTMQLQWRQTHASTDAAKTTWRWQIPQLALSNDDVTVNAKVNAQGVGQEKSDEKAGEWNIRGEVAHMQLSAIGRYLPAAVPPSLKTYLSQALQAGAAKHVQFRLQGDPATWLDHGVFTIQGQLQDVQYAFIPKVVDSAKPSGSADAAAAAVSKPWPVLSQLNGRFGFEGKRFALSQIDALVDGQRQFALQGSSASWADIRQPFVGVDLQGVGNLSSVLTTIERTALRDVTKGVLSDATAQGEVPFRVRLHLPLTDMASSKVEGHLRMPPEANASLQWSPDLPVVTGLQGAVAFSNTGFALQSVQGHALGGKVSISGGMSDGATAKLDIQGNVNTGSMPSGLPPSLTRHPLAASVWQRLRGSTDYKAQVVSNAQTLDVQVTSSLQGVTLDFPQPFDKNAAQALPLQLRVLLPNAPEEQLRGALGDTGKSGVRQMPRMAWRLGNLLHGDIRLGDALAWNGFVQLGRGAETAMNTGADLFSDSQWRAAGARLREGLSLAVSLPSLDADAWRALEWGKTTLASVQPMPIAPDGDVLNGLKVLEVQIDELKLAGRTFQQVVAGASREQNTWRANVHTKDVNGYLEYRLNKIQPMLYARLARLHIPASDAKQVEGLLDIQSEQVPALDMAVEEFEWAGKPLGRVDIKAQSQWSQTQLSGVPQREWRIQQLDWSMPEGTLRSSGVWGGKPRRTTLHAELQVQDAGGILKRLRYPDVVSGGQGQLQAKVAWLGAPWQIDFPSLTGQMQVNMTRGRFLKVDPGAGRLLGVLSLQALPRRFALDFRDVFGQGFAFDQFSGQVQVEQGIAATQDLVMKGVLANANIQGKADLGKETQSLRVLVTPDINAGGASLLATLVNPLVGAASYVAQWVLKRPINRINTKTYAIEGSWQDPVVTLVDTQGVP